MGLYGNTQLPVIVVAYHKKKFLQELSTWFDDMIDDNFLVGSKRLDSALAIIERYRSRLVDDTKGLKLANQHSGLPELNQYRFALDDCLDAILNGRTLEGIAESVIAEIRKLEIKILDSLKDAGQEKRWKHIFDSDKALAEAHLHEDESAEFKRLIAKVAAASDQGDRHD